MLISLRPHAHKVESVAGFLHREHCLLYPHISSFYFWALHSFYYFTTLQCSKVHICILLFSSHIYVWVYTEIFTTSGTCFIIHIHVSVCSFFSENTLNGYIQHCLFVYAKTSLLHSVGAEGRIELIVLPSTFFSLIKFLKALKLGQCFLWIHSTR